MCYPSHGFPHLMLLKTKNYRSRMKMIERIFNNCKILFSGKYCNAWEMTEMTDQIHYANIHLHRHGL